MARDTGAGSTAKRAARPTKPLMPWLTTTAATEALGRLHGGRVNRNTVQQACLRYRHRLEGRISDDQPIDPKAAERESLEPGPRELRCNWQPMGTQRWLYLIDPSEDNLKHLQLRWPNSYTGPGRKVGGPKRRPKDEGSADGGAQVDAHLVGMAEGWAAQTAMA